jgi:hypothetical protein
MPIPAPDPSLDAQYALFYLGTKVQGGKNNFGDIATVVSEYVRSFHYKCPTDPNSSEYQRLSKKIGLRNDWNINKNGDMTFTYAQVVTVPTEDLIKSYLKQFDEDWQVSISTKLDGNKSMIIFYVKSNKSWYIAAPEQSEYIFILKMAPDTSLIENIIEKNSSDKLVKNSNNKFIIENRDDISALNDVFPECIKLYPEPVYTIHISQLPASFSQSYEVGNKVLLHIFERIAGQENVVYYSPSTLGIFCTNGTLFLTQHGVEQFEKLRVVFDIKGVHVISAGYDREAFKRYIDSKIPVRLCYKGSTDNSGPLFPILTQKPGKNEMYMWHYTSDVSNNLIFTYMKDSNLTIFKINYPWDKPVERVLAEKGMIQFSSELNKFIALHQQNHPGSPLPPQVNIWNHSNGIVDDRLPGTLPMPCAHPAPKKQEYYLIGYNPDRMNYLKMLRSPLRKNYVLKINYHEVNNKIKLLKKHLLTLQERGAQVNSKLQQETSILLQLEYQDSVNEINDVGAQIQQLKSQKATIKMQIDESEGFITSIRLKLDDTPQSVKRTSPQNRGIFSPSPAPSSPATTYTMVRGALGDSYPARALFPY